MKVFNKRAKFDYELTPEKLEAGIVLKGIEAKSFRDGRANLSQSYAKIMSGEMFLINANIPVENANKYDSSRIRKLLLHKNEILAIETKMKQKKLQIVPISMYNNGRRIKIELVLGKSKKEFQKKDSIKRKDIERDIEREFRSKDY
jgi:SsrA-binding protein